MRFILNVVAAFLGALAAVAVLFFFGFVLVAAFAGGDGLPEVESGSVLLLDLGGDLPETEPIDPFEELLGGPVTTVRDVTEALEKAAVDDRIAGVWMRPDGFGGSWATAGALRRALLDFRESGKPLVATSGPDGFSELDYYLASVADSVFAPPEAMFELNGLYLAVPFFRGTLDKLGVEPVVIRAGAYKSAAETYTRRSFSEENREQYEDLLEHADRTFRNAVAASRPVTSEALDAVIAEGGLYDAADAVELGLLDGLRYEPEVADAWRAVTDLDLDDDLRVTDLADYVDVPRSAAGLDAGSFGNRIALVYATGVILSGESTSDGAGGTVLGSATFVDAIEEAVADDDVRAIVLRVDSPGGSATASDVMWAAVEEATELVPVVVSMGGVAASGGYYIAAPADAIVAEPNTVTGSIGVISLFFDATELLNDRLGVTLDRIQTGPAAGVYSFTEPLDARERAILERQTEGVYDTFVARVSAGRGLPTDSVRALGGGRVYTGADALRVGLVDRLGGLNTAVALAADLADLLPGDYRLRVLPRRKPLAERLAEAFGASAATRAVAQAIFGDRRDGSTSLEERVLREQAALLRQASEISGRPQTRLFALPEIR